MHLPRSLEVTVLTEDQDGAEDDSLAVLFANAIAGFVTHPQDPDKGGLILKSGEILYTDNTLLELQVKWYDAYNEAAD